MTRILAILMVVTFAVQGMTRAADGVVGDGTPASCTFAELQDEVMVGGTITFNCGASPLTITVTSTLNVTAANTTLNGSNLITLSGANARRIFSVTTLGNNPITLTLQNMSLINGRASGTNEVANGGAINIRNQSIGLNSPPTLNVDNVTFQDNVSNLTSFSGAGIHAYDFGGGAIYASGGAVTVTNSTFINNDANNAAGGAIHILRNNLSISGSNFTDNSAIGSVPANSQGGAIYMDGLRNTGGSFSITGSSFTGNTTYNSGGAIYVNLYENNSPFTVDSSSFINNAVIGGTSALGGAISGGGTSLGGSTGNPSITITNSLFSGNSVRRSGSPQDGSGGALAFAQRARITIANVTFTGNTAHGTSYNANGGAVYILNNTEQFQIINSTIANNHAGWVGGGVINSTLPSSQTPGGIIRNTIFANNTADNGTNDWDIQQHCGAIETNPGVSVIPALVNGGNNLQFPNRNPNLNYWNETVCASGITIADAQLAALANNGGSTQTRALMAGSPAIDAGNNTVCAAAPVSNLDQRGQTRPIDGDGNASAVCDVGAFEFVSNQPPFAPPLTSPGVNATLTNKTVMFSWSAGGFAQDYRLQMDDDPGFGSPLVDSTSTQLSYTAAYLEVGVYYWRVQSINAFGDAWSASRSFTVASAAGSAPTQNYFTTQTPTLTWGRLNGAASYKVEIDDAINFSSPTTLVVIHPTATPTLTNGVYYWRVAACAAVDGTGCGGWSAVESFIVNG